MVEVNRLTPQLGAEITGVDLKRLSDAEFAAIYQAFLDSHVTVVRGQELGIHDYLGYSGRYGVVREHVNKSARHPEFPKLMLLDNMANGAVAAPTPTLIKRGVGWHSDLGYEAVPAKATGLYAIILPSRGGDTLFSNMHLAYERLPEALKRRIDGRRATFKYGGRTKRSLALLREEDRDQPVVMHDIVRVHPETGRKAIYISPTQILEIEGMTPEDSATVIAELESCIEQPEITYRHKWEVGDTVVWDNRCLLHTATGDYPPNERRLHWRTTIMPPEIA